MGNRPRTRDEGKKPTFIEEARRRQILDVAIEEIAQRGYRKTSLDAIAAKAGISKGVIYYHFNGKRELLAQINRALIDELFEYRKARVEARGDAFGRLEAYIDSYFEFVAANARKFSAMIEAGIDLASDLAGNPWAADTNDRAFRYIAAILDEGKRRGELVDVPSRALAPVIQGALDGIALQRFSDPEGVDIEKCKRELFRMIGAYARAESGPPPGSQ